MSTIDELLHQHVTLDVQSLDRIYLNGYVPNLQVPGQLVNFLCQHRGNTIPSPALLQRIGEVFVRGVHSFSEENGIPIVHFQPGVRKDDIASGYRQAFKAAEGVVFIGVAQEKAQAFRAHKRSEGNKVGFDYSRQSVCVNHYYYYLQDEDFGPAFLKVCSYSPFGIKICLNGHEWAKQQLRKAGIPFEALDNGFLSCPEPDRLQSICDQLGVEQIQAFFDKWLTRLPMPVTQQDWEGGYRYRLSVWQVEISRTQIFSEPVRGREFFEEVIRENLDLGRPDRIQLVFERRVQKNTPGPSRTRVIQEGVAPSLHVQYKKCHVKQYFKEGHGLRTETTINDPTDLGVGKDICNLPYLQQVGREVNRRLLDVQRVSQDCTLSKESVDRVVQPTITADGQRAPGLKFGDTRVMALLAALILFLHLTNGLTHRALRQQVAAYLGVDLSAYTSAQMSYDLRRLRLKGILWRVPKSHRYLVTPYGYKVALLFTKLNARVFRTTFASLEPSEPIPRPLAEAFKEVDRQIDAIVDHAKLAAVA